MKNTLVKPSREHLQYLFTKPSSSTNTLTVGFQQYFSENLFIWNLPKRSDSWKNCKRRESANRSLLPKKKGLPEEPPKKQIQRSPHPEKVQRRTHSERNSTVFKREQDAHEFGCVFAECSVLGAASLSPKTLKPKRPIWHLDPMGCPLKSWPRTLGPRTSPPSVFHDQYVSEIQESLRQIWPTSFFFCLFLFVSFFEIARVFEWFCFVFLFLFSFSVCLCVFIFISLSCFSFVHVLRPLFFRFFFLFFESCRCTPPLHAPKTECPQQKNCLK